MTRLKQVDLLLAGLNDDLGHECFVVRFGEHGFDAVCLRPDGVDQADVFSGWVTVNVIAAGEPISGGEGGGEEDAVLPLDGCQVLADDESRGPVVLQVTVELGQVAHLSPFVGNQDGRTECFVFSLTSAVPVLKSVTELANVGQEATHGDGGQAGGKAP